METKHLSYFKVENFKRFDSLEVNDIGQFNLIVGDNNVGKTTLLEALLFDDEYFDNYLVTLDYLLENRDIILDNYGFNVFDFYLKDSTKGLSYLYQFSNDKNKQHLIITTKRRGDLKDSEINNEILINLKLYEAPNVALFTTNDITVSKVIRIQKDRKDVDYNFPFLGSKIFYDEETYDFSDTISKSNKKLDKFKEDLKFFVPNITSIEVSNSILPQDSIIIRESDSDAPRAISTYGDGFIKLFRCLLKMEFSVNDRLMIDEIDSGIHYSRMKDFLIKIIQCAKNKNVQLFATTHSKECLEYYTKALEELGLQDEGRIIRIANTKSGIKAYTLNYAQFENSIEAESEIR